METQKSDLKQMKAIRNFLLSYRGRSGKLLYAANVFNRIPFVDLIHTTNKIRNSGKV